MGKLLLTAPITFLLLLASCQSEPVEVVDMDKVLEIFDRVTTSEPPADIADENAGSEIAPMDASPEKTSAFLALFAKELNAAKISKYPIGVQMLESGAIEGFRDRDGNSVKDSREPQTFKIEIDPESNRVVATQTVADQTYHRDRSYHRHHYHGGYWGYWMYGSMWGRQRTYYSSPTRTRPNYRNTRMSPAGYHTAATSRARASSRSARSRGGSRSFGGGK